MVPEFYAHVRRDKASGNDERQTVADHLNGTAELCKQFAKEFGAMQDGELVGALHDLGKCTDDFQNRLLRNGPIVDHATAGAVECVRRGYLYDAACIAGHHGGLPDFGNLRQSRAGDGTLYGRIKKGIEEGYLERCGESGAAVPKDFLSNAPEQDKLQSSFWTRMLYSCLVDADYLDTERFMNGKKARGEYENIARLLEKLEAYIEPWQRPTTELNRLRCQILNTCIAAGEKEKGLYTLTVPTGGGKTVASLAFGLLHARKHGMKRIVYVIPYTSIIDQNATVFREILGRNNVLEHHSGVQFDLYDGATPEEARKALASENWDMPVVVTTAVQFFESMYANRSSKCRKLHNLANSVIIFDEAQMLPIAHLRPCVAAMASLVEQFHSTVVLCTATQPWLKDLFHTYAPSFLPTELCPETMALYDKFQRVVFRNVGVLEDVVLAQRLSQCHQVLCIVNSRRAAQNIFRILPKDGSYHLSTLMVPAQRQALFREIREKLKTGKPCRVVSTSLIEAGVDVDFPEVYRELAGLDSILQAAGRCNREGKRPIEESVVTIFQRTDAAPPLFAAAVGATQEALKDGTDPGAAETMERYFRSLRDLSGEQLDKDEILKAFEVGIEGCDFPFCTVAEKFRLIDQNTNMVYIPYGDGAKLIAQLQGGMASKDIYRKLGQYAVSVYEPHFKALFNAGALITGQEAPALDGQSGILRDLNWYDLATGLTLDPEVGRAVMA